MSKKKMVICIENVSPYLLVLKSSFCLNILDGDCVV